ncbi:PorT family protein [Hymenobacter sp. 15J16-1T3B]|uniref:outer membrane beta-barrel protein n=1 Tax=Hymenobacter sp. 15J16-1T3B TaxID=2886941 RepID=UPI001D10CD92|nr:outer membrane beta-barrel protein [Hymenobacter sp. 15J16-1T3B]MCC3155979.1 PorT family protein [Hymenobacter sp. 15J16-1T3B]
MPRSTTVFRLLAPALLLSATAASAQTTYRLGLRAGLNRANVTQQVPDQNTSLTYSGTQQKSARLAGQFGVVLEAARGPLALQTGLLFSQKGTVIRSQVTLTSFDSPQYNLYRDGRTVARYHWLELPLNVVYSPGRSGLQLFAGPYVAVGVGGKAATVIHNSSNDPTQQVVPTTRFTDKIEYGPSEAGNGTLSIRGYYSRRLDAGFNAGIGYRRGPVQLQLGYGLGLLNLYQSSVTDQPSIQGGYNRVAQLTGTYFLGH